MGFLKQSVAEYGQSIVMVAHEARSSSYADRVLVLADSHTTKELYKPT